MIGQFDEVFVKENPVWMFMKQLSAVMTHHVSPLRLSALRDKLPILLIVGTGDKVIIINNNNNLQYFYKFFKPVFKTFFLMFILMKIIHPSHTDKLHAALGGHLVKFEGAGHAVTEECLVCSL